MTIQQIFEAIMGQAGVIVLLLVILWSGWRGMWVFGRYYDEQQDRINNLERRLDRAIGQAERGTDLAQRAAQIAERQTEVPSG